MMNPHDEFLQVVIRYTDGAAPLSELTTWLEAHAEVAFESAEERELIYGTWSLISEYDLGVIDEESVREELRAMRVAA